GVPHRAGREPFVARREVRAAGDGEAYEAEQLVELALARLARLWVAAPELEAGVAWWHGSLRLELVGAVVDERPRSEHGQGGARHRDALRGGGRELPGDARERVARPDLVADAAVDPEPAAGLEQREAVLVGGAEDGHVDVRRADDGDGVGEG